MANVSGTEVLQLLELAKSRDSDALGRLFQLYRGYLHLLAASQIDGRLGCKVSASDVVQEAFLHAKCGFPEFKGTTEAELICWLRQILVSRLAMQVRRYTTHMRDINLEQRLEAQMNRSSKALQKSLAARGPSPSGQAVLREQEVVLSDALDAMPKHYRQVLVLRHVKEQSFPEIANQMQRDLENVKSLWRRAIKRLKEELT